MKSTPARWMTMTALLLSGCANQPQSVAIHDTPFTAVWLTADSRADAPHGHPYDMTSETMTAVLTGVQVEERDTVIGFGILGSREGKAAFSQAEIARVGQYLKEGLRKASPKDMVSFYLVVGDANKNRAVTSGGLYMDEKRHLHLMLANWRSVPSGGQDYTMAMELDTRDEPLLPVSPFRFRVGFYPADAWIKNSHESNQPSFPAYHSTYGDPAKVVVIDMDRLETAATQR
jgi:hypothetical protein